MPTMERLFPGFYKILERSIPGFLLFLSKEACRNLIPFSVILDTLATQSHPFTTGIRAIAELKI